MQRQFAFALLIFAVFLLGSIASLGAQDAPPAVQGFYFATTTEGTLEETGDDTYLLTLEGVPQLLDWAVSQPEYFAGGYETAVFAAEWAANEETPLTATAMLRLEEVTLRFTAGAPTYDPLSGTFTFEVSAVEAFPIEEDDKKKGSDIPDEFDAGTLTIVVDTAFDAGLTLGGEILDAEGRVSRSNQSQRPGPPRAKP